MKNLITYLKTLWSRVADSQRKKIGVTLGEATIEHPFSTYSAPFGTCWQPSGKLHSVVRYAAMLVMLLTIGVGNVWATYTITFTGSASESTAISTSTTAASITNSSSYVTGNVAAATKAYGATSSGGIKLGTSSAAGKIKINLSASGQVTPTSIVVNCKLYNSSKSATLGVNGSTKQSVGSSYGDLTFDITSAITYIQIDVTKYVWVKSVTVNTATTKTFTLAVPTGAGGAYNTSKTGQQKTALTEANATSAVSCAAGLNGTYANMWTSTAIATPTYTYPSNVVTSSTADASLPASGTTLYAVFTTNDEGKYTTNPVCNTPCSNSVTVATGSPTNCSISVSSASVSTCSSTESDRYVTVSVQPNTCYAAPVKASVTSTGTTATWVSGPTWNSGTSKYDYVYKFAQNATGSTTFNASLSTKTTYTVSYAAGSVPSGGGSITGSHVNDTKTCGTSMPLPGETFHTTGYTQTGWSKTNGGSQYAAVGGSYTDNAAQTFYPVWTANKYTVTWSVNGSTYQTTSNVSYNTTTSTPANPSVPGECTGSTFMGWTSNSSWASDSAPGDLFNGTTPTITGDITFYAVFADEN